MRHPLRRLATPLAFALAGSLVVAGAALAVVTFDPSSGQGYVDRSDVQQAFGWRNGTFVANARNVTFRAVHRTTWSWTCTIDGHDQQLVTDTETSVQVGATIRGTTRKGAVTSITGYALTGPGAPQSSASPAACPAGAPSAVSSGALDILLAEYGGVSAAVWSR
jgi:hypothetical protein